MKDDSNSWNEEELQMEFDLFVKKSLEKIIRNVLRNYVRIIQIMADCIRLATGRFWN